MSVLRHALAYAERLHWRVFLVGEDCKFPIKHGEDGEPGAWPHGVKDATSDPGELERRLRLYPRANIALACGRGSGVIALDVDNKAGKDGFADLRKLEAEYEPLPRTWKQRTPSGGAHLLFRYPNSGDPRNRVGLKRWDREGRRTVYAGLDVRGENASVALSPSTKASGTYTWEVAPTAGPLAVLPRWLLDLMLSEPPPPPPAPPFNGSYDKAARYCQKVIDGECGEVAATGSGRNQRLFVAACRLGSLVGGNLLPLAVAEDALERAAAECGLTREDGPHAVRATIKSGIQKGLQSPRELRAS